MPVSSNSEEMGNRCVMNLACFQSNLHLMIQPPHPMWADNLVLCVRVFLSYSNLDITLDLPLKTTGSAGKGVKIQLQQGRRCHQEVSVVHNSGDQVKMLPSEHCLPLIATQALS